MRLLDLRTGTSVKGTPEAPLDEVPFTSSTSDHKLENAEGVQKSKGHKVPWKIGMLVYQTVTLRPLVLLQKEAVLSPRNFATTHLTAFTLHVQLPVTSRPMK